MTDDSLGSSDSTGDGRAQPSDHGSLPVSAQIAENHIRSAKELRRLSEEIGSDARLHPIVVFVLSARQAGLELTPQEVRAIVEVGATVYLVSSAELTHRLAALNGVRLSLAHGFAWVWWPTADERSPGQLELVDQLDLSRPAARREIERLTLRLDESERAAGHLPSVLADVKSGASSSGDTVLDFAEVSVLDAWTRLQVFRDVGLDSRELEGVDREDRLHWMIFREWMRLTSFDRRAHPLGYVFGPQFLAFVERLQRVEDDGLAWACAMVACGVESAQLKLRAVAGKMGSQAEQLSRADGARAWEAEVASAGRPDDTWKLRLLCWKPPSGYIEFGSVTCGQAPSTSDE